MGYAKERAVFSLLIWVVVTLLVWERAGLKRGVCREATM